MARVDGIYQTTHQMAERLVEAYVSQAPDPGIEAVRGDTGDKDQDRRVRIS